jgi:hypothetical protein
MALDTVRTPWMVDRVIATHIPSLDGSIATHIPMLNGPIATSTCVRLVHGPWAITYGSFFITSFLPVNRKVAGLIRDEVIFLNLPNPSCHSMQFLVLETLK